MIIVDLWGRLGNQLFQYAFAFTVARKKNTLFSLNPRENNIIAKYFKLDVVTRFLSAKGARKVYRYILRHFNHFDKVIHTGWMDRIEIKNNAHYSGFYQSESFFSDYKETIISKFEIKKTYRRLFEKKYKAIFSENKVIVLHIRRTDYLSHGLDGLGGKNISLPMSFYDMCLGKITDLSKFKVICVSDDIDFVKDYYKDRGFNFETNEEIVDFQLIQNADIVIMANSSFSWWASYLNKRQDKIIYAPKYWFGFKIKKEHPVNIIPDSFIQIEVQ